MITLARFILKGPSQAALVAAVTAILSMLPLLFPFAWISAAAIAVVLLVKGVKPGTQVVFYALIGSCVLTGLVFGAPQLSVYFVLFVWLPVWLPAMVLRQTVSLANSLLTITALSIISVLCMYLLYPDFIEVFRPAFDTFVNRVYEHYSQQMQQISLQQMHEAKELILQLLPGLLASTMLLSAMLSLLLARWWQAVLYNPGGFGSEFRQLQLGKTSAMVAMAITVLAVLVESDMFNALLMVLFTLYLTQGMSILHAISNGKQWSTFWLIVVYGFVLMIPHAVVLLVIAGLADAFINIRQRLLA